MHGGTTDERVVRGANSEPGSDESAQTKDDVTGEDGMVLKLAVDKSSQAQDNGPKPVVEEGVTYSADGMHFATDAQYVVPNAGNLKGEAGTVALTLTPDWGGDDPDLASLMQLRGTTWENRLQLFKDGHFLRVLLTPDTGVESGVGIDISQWPPGEPQHIAASWGATDTGDRFVALYLNGQLMGRAPYQGDLNIAGNDLRIGSDHPGQNQVGARGVINDFKGFDHTLAPDRIAALASPQ